MAAMQVVLMMLHPRSPTYFIIQEIIFKNTHHSLSHLKSAETPSHITIISKFLASS
ncbi:hypothetical protein HanPSC8_Chr10g0425611 [Helianthus annuus]|nr:hypothetical protein HanPSC8_Chr10g0425611 [Helianthus annuus]